MNGMRLDNCVGWDGMRFDNYIGWDGMRLDGMGWDWMNMLDRMG